MRLFSLASLRTFLHDQWHKLHQIRDQPHAVAGGVAIGIFWGFTPFTGLKTLLSLLFAWIFRGSKIAAVIAVSLHDILTPLWPVVLRWEYDLGFWLLSHPHHFPHQLKQVEAHWRDLLHLKTLEILWPMFIGSLFFAIPAAALSYVLVEKSLERYQHRHPEKASAPSQ